MKELRDLHLSSMQKMQRCLVSTLYRGDTTFLTAKSVEMLIYIEPINNIIWSQQLGSVLFVRS